MTSVRKLIRKPRLGQNFLVDDAARHRIVHALGDLSARTVVEIGPGHGAITEILAARAQRLIAVEIDRALAAELRFRFRESPSVEVVEADVLSLDLAALARLDETLDVVGNLPYYITSDILLQLFRAAAEGRLGRAVLMMQREVAERVAAAPGVRDYGLLSATTQMYAEVESLFTLPPTAFNPPPDVYSTVIRLHFRPRFVQLGVDPAGFGLFLKQAFAQKRKTLRNNLQFAGWTPDSLVSAWPASLPDQVRAEQVSLEDMAALYRSSRRDKPGPPPCRRPKVFKRREIDLTAECTISGACPFSELLFGPGGLGIGVSGSRRCCRRR